MKHLRGALYGMLCFAVAIGAVGLGAVAVHFLGQWGLVIIGFALFAIVGAIVA